MTVTKSLVAAALVVTVAASRASAALLITEVMSSSGSGGTADWFELTNTGPAAVSLAGFLMDDSSNSIPLAVPLVGVASLAPGESAMFLESADAAVDVPAFRTFWSGSASGLAGVQIGSYSGSGVGLSSGGDGITIFDSTGTPVAGPIAFPAATAGVSFGFNPATMTFGGLSVAGQFGASTSANALGNVGSPGTVEIPEPTTVALTTLAGLLLAAAARSARRR